MPKTYSGVRRHSHRFEARIALNGARRSLGFFDTAEEAHSAYLAARETADAAKPIPYYERTEPLTANRLRDVLDYNPDTGVFRRKSRAGVVDGAVAGTLKDDGYRQIRVDGRKYYAAKLAWLYMTGEWPSFDVDHRDGRRDNNRFTNLRPASRSENQQNVGLRKDTTTGFHGVSWSPEAKRFRARIMVDGRSHFLGAFTDPLQAREAYLRAKRELHRFQPKPRDL